MSSQLPEHGEDWTKQFRKVTVAGGPLKGARYSEVSVEDLKRSARSYRADPRFNQYAKRMVSELALGDANSASSTRKNGSEPQSRCCSWRRTREWGSWILLKAKGRIFLAVFTFMVLLLVLSRPLFYVVFARGLRVVVRLALRRSVGLLVLLIDALLDEAAASLEAGLIAPPSVNPLVTDNQVQFELQQQNSLSALLINGFFTLAGLLLGRHWRAGAHARVPTRLRVV